MLAATVREAARRFGAAPAYVDADDPTRRLTFADLDRDSDAAAAVLAAQGIGPGDVIAVALPTCLAWPVVYAAAAKLGAVTAGVNERLTRAERSDLLAVAQPDLVVEDEARVTQLVELGRGRRPPERQERLGDPVAICFTSGSTGTPKGAVFTGRQLAAITRTDVGDAWGSGGVSLGTTTFAHLGPMTKLPGALRRGGTTHLLRRWSPEAALAHTARVGASVIAGIPTQVALMLAEPGLSGADLSALRMVVVGGGPATPALVREARAVFGVPVCVRYACTEAGTGLGTAPDDPPEDAEVSVGRPRGAVELAVRTGGDDVGRGQVGEVLLRSEAVMDGYHGDPEATASVLTSDGFVRTGDLGWVDDRGRLHLAGRTSERYVRGGENVHPQEVEAVLADHPRVRDIVVVGVPDPVWGEVGVAVVVPHGDPPSLEELRRFGGRRLAAHKLPARLEVAGHLPLTAGHKVDRRRLRAGLVGHSSAGPRGS